VSKDGGSLSILAKTEFRVFNLAESGSDVFWQEQWVSPDGSSYLNRLWRLPKAGGTPTVLWEGEASISNLATGPNEVVWGEFREVPSGYEIDLYRQALGGGAPVLLTTDAVPVWPFRLVVDSSHVYWNTSGALRRVALAGGTAESVALEAGDVESLVVNDDNVYWVAKLGQECVIRYAGKSGGSIGTIHTYPFVEESVSCIVSPEALAVGAEHVYWSASPSTGPDAAGQVLRKKFSGGQEQVIADGQPGPFSIAAEGEDVFWVNVGTALKSADGSFSRYAGGAVMRRTRTPLN
jgi:hypothetical protein